MAVGDQTDLFTRIKRQIPPWFGDDTPLLDSLVQGIAWALSWLWSLYAYAQLQTRIQTSTDGWLDLTSLDFFGDAWPRHAGQTDASYLNTILTLLVCPKNTRAAIIHVLTGLTGAAPVIREMQLASDGCTYSGVGGYSVGLAYGSTLPFQLFVDAYRPLSDTIWSWTTDADVFAAVNWVRAAGIKVWVRINDQAGVDQFAVTDTDTPGITDTSLNVLAG